MSLRELRVLGVPEHFNRPWVRDRARESFRAAGIDLKFVVEGGGTGAMIKRVIEGDADVAVALTEGIVNAIVVNEGGSTPLRYCGEYVTSPLRWMAATGAARGFKTLADIGAAAAADPNRRITVSVSRFGSGSHLMAHLLALREAWPTDRLDFAVHGDFRSMRRAVCEGAADVFIWEWFMTKPFVVASELHALGYLDTPWHCFGFVARSSWLDDPAHRRLLHEASQVVFRECRAFLEAENEACEELSAHFGIALEDAHSWIRMVAFAQGEELSAPAPMLAGVLESLVSLGILPAGPRGAKAAAGGYSLDTIVDSRTARLVCAEGVGESADPARLSEGAVREWEAMVPMVSIASLEEEQSGGRDAGTGATAGADEGTFRAGASGTGIDGAPGADMGADRSSSSSSSSSSSLVHAVAAARGASPGKPSRRVSGGGMPAPASPQQLRGPEPISAPLSASASESGIALSLSFPMPSSDRSSSFSAPGTSGKGAAEGEDAGPKDIFTSFPAQFSSSSGPSRGRGRSDSSGSTGSVGGGGIGGGGAGSGSASAAALVARERERDRLRRLRSADSLPVEPDPSAGVRYSSHKASALDAVLRHLNSFGGVDVVPKPVTNAPAIPFRAVPEVVERIREGIAPGGGANASPGSGGGGATSSSAAGLGTWTGKAGERAEDRPGGEGGAAPRSAWHARGVLVDLG
jgi:sulfonate transport system substrate-binding protein